MDLVKADVELFRRNLRKRRQDPLPELGLTGEDRYGFIWLKPNPSFQPAIVAQAERNIWRRLAKDGWRCQREGRKHDT
nr:hypothetical protein [Bradyrhizobium diazoefficiens]